MRAHRDHGSARGASVIVGSALVLALLWCSSCGRGPGATREGEDTVATARTGASASAAPASALTNRVWARSDSTGLPGVMRIFLGDGVLLMDSCWETYRLARWRMESESTLVWQEDAMEIRAAILEIDDNTLVLRLDLVDGPHVERYRVAAAPYVCPDMQKGPPLTRPN